MLGSCFLTETMFNTFREQTYNILVHSLETSQNLYKSVKHITTKLLLVANYLQFAAYPKLLGLPANIPSNKNKHMKGAPSDLSNDPKAAWPTLVKLFDGKCHWIPSLTTAVQFMNLRMGLTWKQASCCLINMLTVQSADISPANTAVAIGHRTLRTGYRFHSTNRISTTPR